MYKVFFVEDETAVRQAIIRTVDWEEEGFQICGEASDGEQALPLIIERQPDILITDIKMPFMDGLELARLAKKNLPTLIVIFISGYDDFLFTHEAIRLGVVDYVLKPVTAGKMIQALNRAVDRIVGYSDAQKTSSLMSGPEDEIRRMNEAMITGESWYGAWRNEIIAFLKNATLSQIPEFAGRLSRQCDQIANHSRTFFLYCAFDMIVTVNRTAGEMGLDLPIQEKQEELALQISDVRQLEIFLNRLLQRIIKLRCAMSDNRARAVWNARQIIEMRYKEPDLSVQSVAAEVGVSPNYLTTLMSKELGETFTEYLNKVRVREAASLLKSNNGSLAVIAAAVGYRDPYYFSKIFKKVLGISPREFRKM